MGSILLSAQEAARLLLLDAKEQSRLLPSLLTESWKRRIAACHSLAAAVTPLYVTSICAETCTYCNYRRANRSRYIERKRLSDAQLLKEAKHLIGNKGYKALELVYAGDPAIGPSDIARHVDLIHKVLDSAGGGIVGINALPMGTEDYRLLIG